MNMVEKENQNNISSDLQFDILPGCLYLQISFDSS